MTATELQRTVQESWAAGMVRTGRPDQIPSNGAYDITNGLLDASGGVYKRGGSSYRSKAAFGAGLRLVWDGWLAHGGQTTILASTTAFGKLNAEGNVVNLEHGGLTVPGRPASYNGVLYLPGGVTYDGETVAKAAKEEPYYAVVANRLLAGSGHTVYFSKIKTPGTFEATDLWELPGGIEILGVESLRQSAIVFTTRGVWVISEMGKNLTDEAGNLQQTLDLYSSDLVLWGSGGIAAWEGGLIVPGTDAVWLVSLGVSSEKSQPFQRLSDAIEPLYREYVSNGYQAGQATVFANHYILPVIGNGEIVDVLVCRLDMQPVPKQSNWRPWTHLSGFGATCGAFATRVSSTSQRTPELLGGTYGASARVLNGLFFAPGPAAMLDADGSVHKWSLTTRSYATGNLVANLINKIRLRYQMFNPNAAPKMKLEIAVETPSKGLSVWGLFKWGAAVWGLPSAAAFEPVSGEAQQSTDAVVPFVWRVRKKRRLIRFRFSSADAVVALAVKSLELFVRPDGRV